MSFSISIALNRVGFNLQLLGKECTDNDIIMRTKKEYVHISFIGEFWAMDNRGWRSRYVLNPHIGQFSKTDVNVELEQIGISSGRDSNKLKIGLTKI